MRAQTHLPHAKQVLWNLLLSSVSTALHVIHVDYNYKENDGRELVQRLAYLRIPQHDHSDQHNIYVNTQGFIVVDFIHLRNKKIIKKKIEKKKITDDSKRSPKAMYVLFLIPRQSS